MTCTRRLLGVTWHHHDWRRRVTATEYQPTVEVDMWGRPVRGRAIRCDAEYVCQTCGATRPDGSCTCDAEQGESCPARLVLLDTLTHHQG